MPRTRFRFLHPSASQPAVVGLSALLAGGLLAAGCPRDTTAKPGTPLYTDVVRAFYIGLTALQTSDNDRAEIQLTRAQQLAPNEPAVWADLGLLRIRQGKLEEADQALAKAREIAPQNGAIILLSGVLQERSNRYPEAAVLYQKALELDKNNLRAAWSLAQTGDKIGGTEGDKLAEQGLSRVLELTPDSLPALLAAARTAARRNDAASLKQRVSQLLAEIAKLPNRADGPSVATLSEQTVELKSAVAGGNGRAAVTPLLYLGNALKPFTAYQRALARLEVPLGEVAEPVERFLVLPVPKAEAAALDTGLTFAPAPPVTAINGAVSLVRAVYLNGEGKPALFAVGTGEIRRLDAPGTALPISVLPPGATPPSLVGADSLLPVDGNFDFLTDLVFAGSSGVRVYRQSASGTFADITKAAFPLPLPGAFSGAYAADFDLDGDLDLLLTRADKGGIVALRNSGASVYQAVPLFEAVTGTVTEFAWGDVDGDGTPDAVFVENGKVRVFANQRSGRFAALPTAPDAPKVVSVVVADVLGNGEAGGEVVCLHDNGLVTRLAWNNETQKWTQTEAAQSGVQNPVCVFVADMDNNGAPDLIVSGQKETRVLLGDASGKFTPLSAPVPLRTDDIADTDGDGLLDLIGVGADGKPAIYRGQGTKKYHYLSVRPRAREDENRPSQALGDQRVNAFGIGGQIAVRAGLLTQEQTVRAPVVHFGLGEQAKGDAIRIIWPNGVPRAEFDLQTDQPVRLAHRLNVSCPFLFTHNGDGWQFVTDCIWRSPLGLKINALDTADIAMTEDWVKIRGDQLRARNGFYNLRITAELWETHFFDYLGLLVVDHPDDTEVWVDERFAVPPPPLDLIVTGPSRSLVSARDDNGDDMTDLLARRDGRHLDSFGYGPYFGVSRDHFVEVELPASVRQSATPIYLICHGWVRPTDSNINVALSHSDEAGPSGLALYAEGENGWTLAKENLGFPAGKVKTVVLRVDDCLPPAADNAPVRLRLRTNLEVYWEQITWAEGRPDVSPDVRRVPLTAAELAYRGFSAVEAKDDTSPELPRAYEHIAQTVQKWRDLEGFYTRFGDVLPLLESSDDRYVIMNAGDELKLQFAAPPEPAQQLRRNFVLVGDGWVKDGNWNTTWSRTVLPLPSHDNPCYDGTPGRLEDDSVYQRFSEDWQNFHTRYVTSARFGRGLQKWNV